MYLMLIKLWVHNPSPTVSLDIQLNLVFLYNPFDLSAPRQFLLIRREIRQVREEDPDELRRTGLSSSSSYASLSSESLPLLRRLSLAPADLQKVIPAASIWLELQDRSFLVRALLRSSTMMAPRKRCAVANVEEPNEASILQLPELALECILEKLPPAGLCSMAAVCSSLREICTSDRLWERHVIQKWWRLFGPAARREWKFHLPSGKDSSPPPPPAPVAGNESNRWIGMLSCVSPVGWLRTKTDSGKKAGQSPPDCSIRALYRALENGQFWLPAQVYNREVTIRLQNLCVYHPQMCRTCVWLLKFWTKCSCFSVNQFMVVGA